MSISSEEIRYTGFRFIGKNSFSHLKLLLEGNVHIFLITK